MSKAEKMDTLKNNPLDVPIDFTKYVFKFAGKTVLINLQDE